MPKKPQQTFEIPEGFLHHLEEFTKGFLLVAIDNSGEFRTYVNVDDGVSKMGLIGYTKLKLVDMEEQFQFEYSMGGIDDDGFCEAWDEDEEDRFENGGGDAPR